MDGIKILSLFDGISCARVALKKAKIKVAEYYASEVDKYAIQIAQKNWPETVQLGDVRNVTSKGEHWIDLLIGGSPCQDLSIAKANRKGLKGERSGLFYEFLRIRNEVRPRYFILENVASMPKEARDEITKELGVEPVMINASLVSAQNRKRLFWVGQISSKKGRYEPVEIRQPKDRGILLKDILEEGDVPFTKYGLEKLKSNTVKSSGRGSGIDDKHNWDTIRVGQFGRGGQGDRVYSPDGKSVALSANGGGRGAKTGLYLNEGVIRKLTPIECERLQGLPDNYTEGLSNTQRYKTLGNAFNVDVVTHILKMLNLK
jgi:DNA (cytosine-5)-methyltransferase 3A